MDDTYKTIESPSDAILYKEKSSKFFGYAFPIQAELDVKPIIDNLKKRHLHAVHFCYAYQLGTNTVIYRANDDGEPNNSAGMPIYGQIQSYELTNVLVVIVRIFGGVKLGIGRLILAYKTSAQITLASTFIIEKTIDVHFLLSFDYKNINKVMRVVKEKNIQIVSQKMGMQCEIEIVSRKKQAKIIFEIFNTMFEIEIKENYLF